MADLSLSDWRLIEATFINSGYVLDLSNDAFAEFFQTEFGVDIYAEAYSAKGNSKGNRLRAFLGREDNPRAAQALGALWMYKRSIVNGSELGESTIDHIEELIRRLSVRAAQMPSTSASPDGSQPKPVLQRPLHRETLKLLIDRFRVDDDEGGDLSTSWVLEMFAATGVDASAARFTGLRGFALTAALINDCNEVPGALERFFMIYLEPRRYALEPSVLSQVLGELNDILNPDGIRLTRHGLTVRLELVDPVFGEQDEDLATERSFPASADDDKPPSSALPKHEQAIRLLCERFHQGAVQLRNRRAPRDPLLINDEYDVQYLMHALLKLFFDDVRAEETTPSYAGGSARMDFLISDCSFGFEMKMARDSMSSRSLGEELIIDAIRYRQHPSCRKLYCFVYDPRHLIENPKGIENDMTRDFDGLPTAVVIRP